MEGSHELLRIEDKSFLDTVIGAFGDIKVCTERKNGGELSGKPRIKKGDKETGRVGRIGDDNGNEKGMG